MKRIYLIALLSFFSLALRAQYYTLFSQNFEISANINAVLNDPAHTVTGRNRWVINDEYDGHSIYPNSQRQDSTYSGTIYNAPYSIYLHIYDTVTATTSSPLVANSNFDPTAASDNFVILDDNGICTMGLDTVIISFFYTCEGSPGAYAELYYSRNGGASWTQTGQPQYNSTPKWKYEFVTDPGFANTANLIFGVRWVNNSGSPPATTSFGIDDIVIAGHASPIQTSITFDSVVTTSMCIGRYLYLYYSLSDTMCDGWYQLQMSDLTGDFTLPTPFTIFPINPPQTHGGLGIFIPNSVFPGPCYRFTITRFSPNYPPIFIDTTVCVDIHYCSDTVQTLGPALALQDPLNPNHICAGSVIDVNFFSTGTFILNTYKLQLSDVNGNFVHPDSAGAIIIGQNQSDITYDPANPTPGYLPPGGVSGLIPDTMTAGCNYYYRVLATGPANPPPPLVGNAYGPFCIDHCDIITNNEQDFGVNLCITEFDTLCVNLPVNMHFFDTTAIYNPGNQFEVQVLSRNPLTPMAQVGPLGCLGSVTAINDATLQLCIGPLSSMLGWGIFPNPPASYYLRIVSTNPSMSLGSLVRFQYGFLHDDTPAVAVYSLPSFQPITYACVGEVGYFVVVNPPNPPADQWASYEWSGPFVGSPIVRPYNQGGMSILFTGNGNYTFPITCTQVSGVNCRSLSRTVSFPVFGPPNVNIIGPPNICLGDTIKYRVIPQNGNFFYWQTYSPNAAITDTANNEAWFTFDSIGTYQISVNVSNPCSTATGFKTINVVLPPVADAGLDTVSVCTGDTVTLASSPDSASWTYTWKLKSGTLLGVGNSYDAHPTTATQYFVYVSNGVCSRKDSVRVLVEQPTQVGFSDSVCIDGPPITLDPGGGALSYEWYDNSTSQTHAVSASGTYSVNLQMPNEVCYRVYTYTVGYVYPDSSAQDAEICYGDPLVLDAGEPGAQYRWSTGANDTLQQDTVTSAGTYRVEITFPTQRCAYTKIFNVTDDPDLCPRDFRLPNVFTPNGDGFNDTFHAYTFGNYHSFYIKIYGRWGELVFESTDPGFSWNGMNLDGKECPAGVYYYIANADHPGDAKVLHGTVVILKDK